MDIMDLYVHNLECRCDVYASIVGHYEALLNYSIMALKGETVASNEQVAKHIILQRNRLNEQLDSLVNNKKQNT